jgi:hypothetical protein
LARTPFWRDFAKPGYVHLHNFAALRNSSKGTAMDGSILLKDDICDGAGEIGDFIGVEERAAIRLCYTCQIPAWKEGGKWRMRKSRYLQHIREKEVTNTPDGRASR